MRELAIVFAAAAACGKRSEPTPVEGAAKSTAHDLVGSAKRGDDVAVAAPTGASHADWIRPTKHVAFIKPTRPPNDQERVLGGTWVAKTGDYATRSAFMADRQMFALGAGSGALVDKALDALAHDDKIASNCIWLELRPDFTGIRRECAIVNGDPSALDQTDFTTGKKIDLGTKLEWFIDESDRNTVKIRFAADMIVPAMRGGKLRQLVFRDWWIALHKQVGDNLFAVTERVPEHDYTLPTEYSYEIAPQRFLDSK
jgi:hypothetical protein